MKNSILLVFTLVYSFVFSQDLTVERIWKNYEFSPKRIGGFKSMNDGEHYTNMKEGNSIYKFSLNDVNDKGAVILDGSKLLVDGKKLSFDDYEFNSDETKILLLTNVESIYRRSFQAVYYLYDLATQKLTPLDSEHTPQTLAEYSPDGTKVSFIPDEAIFKKYKYRNEYVSKMLKNYVYLNTGLTIVFNGEKYVSENGLKDLLEDNNNLEDMLYPIIHLKGDDIEVAITHSKTQYSEEYHSFVNGQHTTQGGTHQAAFREAIVKTIREFYGKNFEASDIRKSIISAIAIKVMEPVFESQTKTKLGSTDMGGDLPTVRTYINDFLKTKLDNFLHKNTDTAEALQRKIIQAEKERKELSGIRKLAKDRAKKSSLHNKKLRDCRIHLGDTKKEAYLDSTLFITEGDSASGSITKSRNVNTQAVFSLKGKPLNSFGLSKKIVYENEEFNLLQAALNIEDGLQDLRYNNIVIATDADVDGMHIRLLLITFFLQFFPEVIKEGHLYILETPLFRVRNKKDTFYCYSEEEKRVAIGKLKGKPEITRFKGLGEISPNEFVHFIGDDIRLDPVMLDKEMSIEQMLQFYIGKNTPDRQKFIIENLKVELDSIEEEF